MKNPCRKFFSNSQYEKNSLFEKSIHIINCLLFLQLIVFFMMIPIRSVGAENSEYDYSEFQRAKNQAVKYLNSKLAIGVPIASYETKIPSMKNAAYTYDNALTALAYIAEGKHRNAAKILDSLVQGIQNDRFRPDRIRNVYLAGNSNYPAHWWDGDWMEDAAQVGTTTGNSAFAALAFLQYYHRWGNEIYLQTAEIIMNWVLENCQDQNSGFTGGYKGWPEKDQIDVLTFKSTEHNIDAFAAFQQLFYITGEEKYQTAMESAREFIRSMYDENGYFYIGTQSDGITPTKGNIILDVHVWTILALGKDFLPDPSVIDMVISMKTTEGGFPFHKENTKGGFWSEGTAFSALAFRNMGMDADAFSALRLLEQIQLDNGGFPAATVENLSTGDGWGYNQDTHIAPAAWFIMAVDNFSPFVFMK